MAGRKNGNENNDIGGLGGIFTGLAKLIEVASKLEKNGEKVFSETGDLKGLNDKLKGVYGFSVKMGGHGSHIVEGFGNIKDSEDGPIIEDVREPIVDVFVEDAQILVVAELPGVEENEINIELKGDILVVSATAKSVPGRKYAKEILLEVPVQTETIEKHYRNGILEVKISRKPA
ncbi:MAG: Hsp20/alpha crystallin family protein [Negativicutes bacterium]